MTAPYASTLPDPNRETKLLELPPSSRYRLMRCIALGGMGAIYMGVQRGAAGFERPVAIKRAHPHLLRHPEVREAIMSEARNGSLVRHPNVVSIDDVDEADGELLLVMDYIDGGSLAQLSQPDTPIPLSVALRIMLDVCAGLDAIHNATDRGGKRLGLVHRDISPQNILVGTDGVARITDFGIAKGANDPGRTNPSMRRGKFGYLAPEYIRYRIFGPSADMFALGVVFWEALAGRRLFAGATPTESIRLGAAAVIPNLAKINPAVSSELDTVIRTVLARSPDRRYATLRDFGEALESLNRGLIATRAEVGAFVVARQNGKKAHLGTRDIPIEEASDEPRSFDIDMSSLEMDIETVEMVVSDRRPERSSSPHVYRALDWAESPFARPASNAPSRAAPPRASMTRGFEPHLPSRVPAHSGMMHVRPHGARRPRPKTTSSTVRLIAVATIFLALGTTAALARAGVLPTRANTSSPTCAPDATTHLFCTPDAAAPAR